MARSSNFSYSDKPKFGGGIHASSADTQPDDFLDSRSSSSTDHEINDMVHKKNLLNSKLRMAGGRTLITPLKQSSVIYNVNKIAVKFCLKNLADVSTFSDVIFKSKENSMHDLEILEKVIDH